MADGSEGALDGVAGADVLPMHGREIVERQQRPAIFGQAGGRLVKFHLVFGEEAVEGFFGIGTSLRHPNRLEIRLGFGLHGLRQFIQYIQEANVYRERQALTQCLMHLASLLSRRAEFFLKRLPEPKRAITDGEFRRDGKASGFQACPRADGGGANSSRQDWALSR
jgi:hypothetical protein